MDLSLSSSNMAFPNLEALAAVRSLVLGSGSPRRVRLLGETGIEFSQLVPEIEELRSPDEEPFPYAKRLAEEKAAWAMPKLEQYQLVIACDTIVVLGNRVLEKPTDAADAERILSALAGHRHVVCTALTLADRNSILASDYDTTGVFFNDVSTEQIHDYIATGEPMDKAGAYGIQGMGAFLVDRIEGNLDTVIGLPRLLLEDLAGRVRATLN